MKNVEIITEKEMEAAIFKSGYLLEQRVENILQKYDYFVTTNDAYLDPVTGKSREIDIDAISGFQLSKDYDFLFSRLLCECENNQQPVVFFIKDSPTSFLNSNYIKCAGLPIQFIDGKYEPKKEPFSDFNYEYIDLPDFLKVEKFHHYCMRTISTQYCSFNRKKVDSPWVASHIENQHNSLDSLIFSMEARINDYYEDYVVSEYSEESINIEIYYPLLILQGPLYSSRLEKGKLELKKEQHILYIKEFHSKDKKDTYVIDVITEEYLPKYLDIVKNEMIVMKNRLKRKKEIVRISLNTLIEKAKRKKDSETLRSIFEF